MNSKIDVDGRRRMGDGADGDEICAGFCVFADCGQIDAARELDFCTARDESDFIGSLTRRHIVEQQMLHAKR